MHSRGNRQAKRALLWGRVRTKRAALCQTPATSTESVSEITLSLAGRVEQGDEDLGLALPEGGDGSTDDAGAALVVVLIA